MVVKTTIINEKEIDETAVVGQVIVGSVSGWCTGFLGMRVGHIAAFALFAGFVILQIANYSGIINVNWNSADRYAERIERSVNAEAPGILDNIADFASRNVILSISFLGGLVVGIGCA